MQHSYKTLIIDEIINILYARDISKINLIELIFNQIYNENINRTSKNSNNDLYNKTMDTIDKYIILIKSVLKDIEFSEKKKITFKIDNKSFSIGVYNRNEEELSNRINKIKKFLNFYENKDDITRIIKSKIKGVERNKELRFKELNYKKNKIMNEIKELELILEIRGKSINFYNNTDLIERLTILNQELLSC